MSKKIKPDNALQTPYPIVAVRATDWNQYSSFCDCSHNFGYAIGWVVGLLIKEDDEKIVIAHEYFEGGETLRNTTVIQRETIREYRIFKP